MVRPCADGGPLRQSSTPAAERATRSEVRGHVTMKEPIARPVRNPGDEHGLSGEQPLRDDQVARRCRVGAIAGPVTSTVEPEAEAVEMHGIEFRRHIEDTPPYRIAHRIPPAPGIA